jgi:type II secretory pathway pseudopilin PulG
MNVRSWKSNIGCWTKSIGYRILGKYSASSIKHPASSIQYPVSRDESGFTLIEILVTTVITMMIIGSVYASFRSSLNAYQRTGTRIIMLQRCRSALDRMAQDMSNLFYVEESDTETAGELILMVQDFSDSETAMDKDMISFVAIVDPDIEEYYTVLEESESLTVIDEEEENLLPSDLARIVYYVGPSPEDETVQSLMRIETTNLDTEELDDMLEELLGSSPSEELLEELQSSVLVDYVAGLNIRYFDGEDWVDEWDMEEEGVGLPNAIEITLTITDANTREKDLTEAVVVYLPMSESQTQEAELAAGGGMQR